MADEITGKTRLPLKLLISGAGALVAAGMWVGTIQFQVKTVEAAEKDDHATISEAVKEIQKVNLTLVEILTVLRQR